MAARCPAPRPSTLPQRPVGHLAAFFLMQLKDQHVRYLNRAARRLSAHVKRHVRPDEVLQVLVDLAIADEGIYDPEDGRPVREGRREIIQAERERRTLEMTDDELLERLKSR